VVYWAYCLYMYVYMWCIGHIAYTCMYICGGLLNS